MARVVGYFGFPSSITADNDARWTGHDFKTWASKWNIKLELTAAQNHNRNGLVERHIDTFSTQLRKLRHQFPVVAWDSFLWALQLAHNSVVHSSTGLTPHALLYTYMPVTPTDIVLPGRPSRSSARETLMDFQRALARMTAAQRATAAYHAQRAHPRTFEVGQAAYVRNPARIGGAKDLPPMWGPFEIVRRCGSDNIYELDIPRRRTGRPANPIFHAEDMVRYNGPWPITEAELLLPPPFLNPEPPGPGQPPPPRPQAPLFPNPTRAARPMQRARPAAPSP